MTINELKIMPELGVTSGSIVNIVYLMVAVALLKIKVLLHYSQLQLS